MANVKVKGLEDEVSGDLRRVRGQVLRPRGEQGLEKDIGLEKLVLDWTGPSRDLNIEGAITDAVLERTIEGASTLTITIYDPQQVFLKASRMYQPVAPKTKGGKKGKTKPKVERDVDGNRIVRPVQRGRTINAELDGLNFRFTKLTKNGPLLTLTFEDRLVFWLRRKGGVERKALRSKMTRAEFILALIREVQTERINFVCPELHDKQEIAKGEGGSGGGSSGGGGSKSDDVKGGWITMGATVFDDAQGNTGPISGPAYAELGEAGGNAGMGGLLGKALGYGKPLPNGHKLEIKLGSKTVTATKQDVGSGQAGDREYKIDLWKSLWTPLGISSSFKGKVQVRDLEKKS